MKLPISWLKEYVEFDDTVEGLCEKLTFSGTEVEGVEKIGDGCDGVVVGEVLAVEKHPGADRLSVCRVSDGQDEFQVVCGAPNVKAGGKYPFARVGVTLPGGFKLKKAKLRGVESQGMLCAEDELGLSDDHEGLMELADDAAIGASMTDIIGPAETVLELEVTPNRPDCLSIIGMAREVAALYGTKLKHPQVPIRESEQRAEVLTSVKIEEPSLCPRYTARILKNVKLGPSPAWMRKRLELVGIRPINNVVDITNYVLMECGHPLHAFDQDLLDEGRIVVRLPKDGEKIVTLDDVERELKPEMLIIADANKPVAVAGVMGGATSEIRESTVNVLLESACFEPDSIRGTSRELGLSSESSYRFERGTDIGGVEWASRRAASLMQQLAGAEVMNGCVDAYPAPVGEQRLLCRLERVNTLLGISISLAEMIACFEALGLPVLEKDDAGCTLLIPTFRRDLEREVDLIEEVARIYGLDRIPSPHPVSRIIPEADDRHIRAVSACLDNLCALGLREIQNYSLLAPKSLDMVDANQTAQREVLPNPISQDQSVLRTSLLPQMIETLGNNLAHQNREVALYESGKVFLRKAEGRPLEEERISLGLLGPVGRGVFDKRKPVTPEEMFRWMKGIIESLLEAQHITCWQLEPVEQACFEAPYAVRFMAGARSLGVMGLLNSRIRNEWRFNEPVAVAELHTRELIRNAFDIQRVVAPGIYPPVERDMALLVNQSIRHEDILQAVNEAAPPELEKIELFDIYQGKNLAEGMKSMAYTLTYRSQDKTLTDEDANAYHNRVKQALRNALDIEIREG
jgi:phenylalanyl-tRNA synthetase beta chain